MSLLRKERHVHREDVGTVLSWRWRFGRNQWRLVFYPDSSWVMSVPLESIEEAQAVLTSSTAQEALAAVAVLQDNWEPVLQQGEDVSDADD